MLPYLVIGILLLGVLSLVAITIAIAIVLVIATWRLQLPEVTGIEVSDYPADQLERQKNLGVKMEAAGLSFVGMQRERRGPKYEVWQALFRTENGTVWGVVEAIANETPRIVFHSFLSNGRTVTSSDGEFADYKITEEWRLTERKCGSLLELAKSHQQQLLGAGGQLVALELDEFRDQYVETARHEFAHLEEIGFLRKVPAEEVYRVIPWKEPTVALRMFVRARRYKWAEQGRRREEASRSEQEAEKKERESSGETGEYKDLEYYQQDREKGTALSLLGWTPRGAILFATIMLMLVISLSRGSLEASTAIIILMVLVVHELGHALAMRVFGYRDAKVFFLPLVGRLAGRRKVCVPTWQEFVTLMMGPVPGLLIGWGLLVYAFFDPSLPTVLQKLGLWAALINNVNLLAVLPYDGGRIVNLLIFERLPAVRVIYLLLSGISVLALVVLGSLAFGSFAFALLWPFLMIGISAFLAVPSNIRFAKMAPWARKNLSPGDDESDALLKSFLIVEQTESGKGLEKRGWTEFVDRVVRFGCSPKLGRGGVVCAMMIFLFFLHTPLWVLVGVTFGEGAKVKKEHLVLQERIDDLSAKVSWGGAVVTKETRADLETLRDDSLGSLQILYSKEVDYADASVDYDSRGIFDPSEAIEKVKNLRWDEVSTWIVEEDTASRQETVRVLVEVLIGEAREQVKRGHPNAAMTGFSRAYWAISTCEPKSSLGAWIDWLYLEQTLLLEFEELMSSRGVPAKFGQWFADTLRKRPRFEGRKLALLLLYDLQGLPLHSVPDIDPEMSLWESLAESGYPLRRSEADRDFRREGGETKNPLSLSSAMGITRIVQGLPTREEFRAGLLVAEHWEGSSALDLSVLEALNDPEQKIVWKARIDRIQRLQHFRLLAIAALEIELFAENPATFSPFETERPPLPVDTTLVQTPEQRFAVMSKAPDGTRFLWSLSPQFVKSRQRAH
jgi:hypothetical protein